MLKALGIYFEECLKYGIEPDMTISHYETPYYLVEKYNSWFSRNVIDFFVNYCKIIFNRYKYKVKYWLTFNEINTMLDHPEFGAGIRKCDENEKYNAIHHMLVASARAVRIGHMINPDFKIGAMIFYPMTYAYTCTPADNLKVMEEMDRHYYFSDVQARGYYYNKAKKILEKKKIRLDLGKEDMYELREGKVAYNGYS